jgi:hypothetical protein
MTTTFAFAPMTQQLLRHAIVSKGPLHAGKGFGSSPPPPKKERSSFFNEESNRSVENPTTTSNNKNEGQRALAELRRERAEQRNAELRQYQEIKSVDEFISSTPDAAVIPEKVAMRMGKRMLPFVGIPLFGGMGTFVGFWYLATYRDMEFQPALVAFTTIAILAVGLLVRYIFIYIFAMCTTTWSIVLVWKVVVWVYLVGSFSCFFSFFLPLFAFQPSWGGGDRALRIR